MKAKCLLDLLFTHRLPLIEQQILTRTADRFDGAIRFIEAGAEDCKQIKKGGVGRSWNINRPPAKIVWLVRDRGRFGRACWGACFLLAQRVLRGRAVLRDLSGWRGLESILGGVSRMRT